MVLVGDARMGLVVGVGEEPRAWVYFAVSAWSLSILVSSVTSALRNTWRWMEEAQEVMDEGDAVATPHRKCIWAVCGSGVTAELLLTPNAEQCRTSSSCCGAQGWNQPLAWGLKSNQVVPAKPGSMGEEEGNPQGWLHWR